MTTQLVRFDTDAITRALLGFDTLFDKRSTQWQASYPPHNVIKYDDDTYELQMAVTGFDPSEISVELNRGELTVKGSHVEEQAVNEPTYLYKGLATRNFTRTFPLAEYMEVGEGTIKNGVLTVALHRIVPEALKPRTIKVTSV